MTQGHSINREDFSAAVQKRLAQDPLLYLLNPKLKEFHFGTPMIVLMKWAPGAARSLSRSFDAENIAMVLGRECARSAAMLAFGHERFYIDQLPFRFVNQVPESATLLCRSLARPSGANPEEPDTLRGVEVKGAVYYIAMDGETKTIANFDASVIQL